MPLSSWQFWGCSGPCCTSSGTFPATALVLEFRKGRRPDSGRRPRFPVDPLPRRRRLWSCLWRRRARIGEVHVRRHARSLRSLEIRVIHLESRPAGKQTVGKLLHVCVVVAKRVVVALSFNRDPVLGARQFILQSH